MKAKAARRFSEAADAMADACRMLEQCGVADEPVERLLQAMEALTHQVHRLHPPDERLIVDEPADLAVPGCRIAAVKAEAGDGCRH